MKLKKGYQALMDEALQQVKTISIDEAAGLLGDEGTEFVDIRDVRELEREGMIPGAVHAPRGMLEFWIDPACKYHRPVFASGKSFLLYCASNWRSALAAKALMDMGFGPVSHMGGGYSAWKKARLPTAARIRKPKS